MFLVLMRYLQDDLPVALFLKREAAEEFVSRIDDVDMEPILEVFRLDVSSPICVQIIEFSDGVTYEDGMFAPVKLDMIRDFEAEMA